MLEGRVDAAGHNCPLVEFRSDLLKGSIFLLSLADEDAVHRYAAITTSE